MWAKREEELLKWLDHDPHSQPCLCAECGLQRENKVMAVQLSLNLPKTQPFPSSGDGSTGNRKLSENTREASTAEKSVEYSPDSRLSPQPETPAAKKATA